MSQFSMFASEEPVQAPMFEQQADEITLLFVGDLLHVTVGRAFTAEQSKTLIGAIRRIPGVQSCKRDACLDGLTENSCFVVQFNRYADSVRRAIRSQIDATIQVKQAGLFDAVQKNPVRAEFYTRNDWRDFAAFLPF